MAVCFEEHVRFLASSESRAHPHYKHKLLDASQGDTVRTIRFGHGWPNAPHRTVRTVFVRQWLGQEGRGQESRPDEPVVGRAVIGGQPMPVLPFMGFPPNSDGSRRRKRPRREGHGSSGFHYRGGDA